MNPRSIYEKGHADAVHAAVLVSMTNASKDQSLHDATYHAEKAGGVGHSQAWAREKKRRRSRMGNFQKKYDLAEDQQRIELEVAWHYIKLLEEIDTRPLKRKLLIDRSEHVTQILMNN